MFRHAVKLAGEFTPPVVLSRRTLAGECSSAIGAFIVVNRQGWILTAAHIVDQFSRMLEQEATVREVESRRRRIDLDTALDPKEKHRLHRRLPQLDRTITARCSAWWTFPGARLMDVRAIPSVDLAVGRLVPFHPEWIKSYPAFKDPDKNFMPGTSLCRLGYPFHIIRPVYHEESDTFELPAGAVPLSVFPLDGILTRLIRVQSAPDSRIPLLMIETSSPGLRGQSGGPIFDIHGAVWGIQVSTAHYSLGFNPPVPGGRPNEREHQFLNVGLGVHATTIHGFLRSLGVEYEVTEY